LESDSYAASQESKPQYLLIWDDRIEHLQTVRAKIKQEGIKKSELES